MCFTSKFRLININLQVQSRKKISQPFNSQEWPRQNFSFQYQYNIKQTGDKNKEKYQLGDYNLIQNQILITNISQELYGRQ